MLYLKNSGGSASLYNPRLRIFFEADNGANATGGTGGAATSTQTGAAGDPNVTSQPPSAWDAISWDELDDNTKRVLETARTDHQRVAGENATLRQQADARQREETARQQQQTRQQQQQNQPAADPYDTTTREVMRKRGFTDAQIDAQAPVLTDLLKEMGNLQRTEMGRELAPFIGTVIARENTSNFEAVHQSPHGQQLLQDPAVAQEVWAIVENHTKQGKTFDPDAILNLAKIVYTDHQLAGGNQQPQPQPPGTTTGSSFFPTVQPPATPNRSTGFSYPGAYARPIYSGGPAPSGPAPVNEDTRAALAQTFGELARTTGVAPKAFPSANATHGGGATRR